MATPRRFEKDFFGRTLSFETGKVAGLANGAVTVQYGETVVLVTVCSGKEPREGVDFLPLTIDYEERLYAAGRIPGGYIRREGRPSEAAILACRLVDRPIRPLLPKTWRKDVQVIITVFSTDKENDPSIMAVTGASAALSLSDVPFDGPVSAVRVGYINNEIVINPTFSQMEESTLDVVVASTSKEVVMLEAGADEIPEDLMIEAIEAGHEANQEIIALQIEMAKEIGKEKQEKPVVEVDSKLVAKVQEIIGDKLEEALKNKDKEPREAAVGAVKTEVFESLVEEYGKTILDDIIEKEAKKIVRRKVIQEGIRVSGRGLKEIRPISCEVGILPRVHGSSLFTRGETQVLNIATLGPINKAQQLDGLGLEETKRYMHHYNFPPYSTGEVRRMGGTGRREIGHGALAEHALLPVIPEEASEFPYTIRLVSECLSSSGSTSMASTCASSLTLMDAGVPIKSAVAGISIGLMTGEDGSFETLTDIEGVEDFYGDMDFKVAGTESGITAIQMDTKLQGLSREVVRKAIHQAKEGRLFILGKMNDAISQSRVDLSKYAPRMHKMVINQDKIGALIGPGGKTIRSIIEATEATVDVESDGTVYVGATNSESAAKAIKMIEDLTKEVEAGQIYTGKVVRIMTFGAFVELLPGKDGLVHISELDAGRVEKVEDVVNIGDEITVKVMEIDSQGRINLSRKALLVSEEEYEAGKKREQRPSGQRPGRSGGKDFRPRGNNRR